MLEDFTEGMKEKSIDIPDDDSKLLPRFGHTLNVDKQTGIMWIFGGYSNMFTSPLNDIRAFDTRKQEWIPITVQISSTAINEPTQKTQHHTRDQDRTKTNPKVGSKKNSKNKSTKALHQQASRVNLRLRHRRWLASVPKLSLLSSSLPLLKSESSQKVIGPPARYLHASALLSRSSSLYIHGGMNKTEYLSDLWCFDIIHRTWQHLPTIWNPHIIMDVGTKQPSIEKEVRI